MRIRLLHGVSGYWNDESYQYSVGSVEVVDDSIGNDLIRNDLAVLETKETKRPIAEPPNITPILGKGKTVQAVIKRGRKRNV